MENSTSPGTTGVFQDWCDPQAHQGHLPAFVKYSSLVNSIINSILACATIIGNILILISLRKTSRLHAASKSLYCNLAVTDLSVGLFVQPLFILRLVTGREGLTDVCRLALLIVTFTGNIMVGVSLQTLSVISVDRMLAICLKMRYKEVATVSRTRVVLVICWFFGTFHAVIMFVSPAFFNLFQILGIILCIGVSTVSYVNIYYNLRLLQNQVQNFDSGNETAPNSSFNIKRYKKTVTTALCVYTSLLACYLPFLLALATRMSIGFSATNLGVLWFTTSLLYMNSALNPVLYCWKIPEVRESVKEILKQCCSCITN